MRSFLRRSLTSTALLVGITVGVTPIVISTQASAQETSPATTPTPTSASTVTFTDVGSDYWAQPFIQALAAKNLISGFPDGTFKPDQPISRAEFATMIQKAFNQNPVRELSASTFTDLPADSMSAAAIEEAYETGFLSGYPNGLFLPNQEIPKVQAIVALASGLNLTPSGSVTDLLGYYTDAEQIPSYAVDDVAAATQTNIVVNYPNVKAFSPLTPLTRAEAAAHLYQALVKLEQAQPLPSSVAAASYIAGITTVAEPSNESAQTTTTPSNIAALAASNNSFTTLNSALQATGLAESLQEPGPFTLFAPTDQAFAALPAGTLEKLLQPENQETLTKILMYHLLRGEYDSSQLKNGRARTVVGRRVRVRVDRENNRITVNDASVSQPDIQATNGVIHAVDKVILPPNFDISKLSQ